MHTVNIHEAKTQLSRLIALAAEGEPFVIAKSGKPLVKVTAISSGDGAPAKRLGFMQGMMQVPSDFDGMGGEVIENLFTGTSA
ncbi:MAG: type II toxin-antitoxin system prevent-host-death family antitoxin [Burkholderiales bacterium PBB3]|nr:MAG: type II toxin-antitoxin system prevent-host-death family antitoxin [Burkholderiales bacterium PBB3]